VKTRRLNDAGCYQIAPKNLEIIIFLKKPEKTSNTTYHKENPLKKTPGWITAKFR
jgi:hypothetical protein